MKVGGSTQLPGSFQCECKTPFQSAGDLLRQTGGQAGHTPPVQSFTQQGRQRRLKSRFLKSRIRESDSPDPPLWKDVSLKQCKTCLGPQNQFCSSPMSSSLKYISQQTTSRRTVLQEGLQEIESQCGAGYSVSKIHFPAGLLNWKQKVFTIKRPQRRDPTSTSLGGGDKNSLVLAGINRQSRG